MTSRCPVCGDTRVQIVASYRHTNKLFTGLSRAVCQGCGLVFASPMPSDAELAAYNASYFETAHGGEPTSPVALAFHSAINRLRVGHVDQYLGRNDISVRSVLEIGPGAGHFARHWMDRHQGTEYHGIESDVSLRSSLRKIGVQVHEGPEDMIGEPAFDLVVMSHVLEHTADPYGFLRAMTARLRHGGALFIEVPCRDWEHKQQDEPHLLFFDKNPMARLLEKLAFGAIKLSYHGREIGDLQTPSLTDRIGGAIRSRLLARGIVFPFAGIAPGLELLEPLERASVAPFQAHIEQIRPAWWLRAAAVKL